MKKYSSLLLLFGCAALFVFGIVQLVRLRFDRGDVYPEYSSLRADPLGTMAFYESLEKISGVTVQRDFSDSDTLPEGRQTVYLHLASPRYEWEWVSKEMYHDLQDFLTRGNRLVITFFPQTESYVFNPHDTNTVEETNTVKKSTQPKSAKIKPPKQIKKKKKLKDDDWGIFLEDKWGFHPEFQKLIEEDGVYSPVHVVNQTDLPLPKVLDWHSGLIFTNCTNLWHVIYSRGTNAVLIERNFGQGSVVLATDSYFVSNEALQSDRHADLLAWLVGPNRKAYFDEAHLGIVETSGVTVLMRKYRLHWFAAGLILVAGLFIWKNATSLAPAHAEEKQDGFVAGKDSASGFVNLLRRSIAPRDLLGVCFSEWKKSTAPANKFSPTRLQAAEAIYQSESSLPKREQNPVAAYKNISTTLGIRNKQL